MGAFEYQALDVRGRSRRGVASADNARQVRQQLREQGLTPVAVNAVNETAGSAGAATQASRRKMSTTELAVITRQFATLIGSGLTLSEALAGLISQTESHQTKSTLSGIRSMIMEGRSLAEALRTFPRAFPEIYTASVSAGEQTGRLAEVLERLADYTEARQSLNQRLSAQLVYPVILIVVAACVVLALFTYVMPKVIRVFEDTGQALPLLTRIMVSISDFLQAYGLALALALGIVALVAVAALRRAGPRYTLHGLFLRTPGVRRISRSLNSARMARTLAIMVGSGVPLLSSLRAATDVVLNQVMRKAMQNVSVEVAQGVSLHRAIARSGRFPPLLTQMIASGEHSGDLDTMLEKAATALERELESRINLLVAYFEPLMILVMGGVVFIIVLSILLPIFDLNQLIH